MNNRFNLEKIQLAEPAKSYVPFPYEGYINHWRSLLMLKDRSPDDYENLFDISRQRIAQFHEYAKDQDASTLRQLGMSQYLQKKKNGKGMEPKPGAMKKANIEPFGSVTDLVALHYSFDFPKIKPKLNGLKSVKRHELFAIMALGYMQDYFTLRYKMLKVWNVPTDKIPQEKLNVKDITNLARTLMLVSEAVGYSERAQETDYVDERYREEIKNLQSVQSNISDEKLSAIRDRLTADFHAQQAARASEKSLKMNDGRHKIERDAREKILEHWQDRRLEYRSADEAGRHYADWDFPGKSGKSKGFAPRVIAGWIRVYAKEKGLRTRN